MMDRIKWIWNYPMKMEEAMWYILLAFFIMVWMWMFIWAD